MYYLTPTTVITSIILVTAFALLSVRAWRRKAIRERTALNEATRVLAYRRDDQRQMETVVRSAFLAALAKSRRYDPRPGDLIVTGNAFWYLEAPEGMP